MTDIYYSLIEHQCSVTRHALQSDMSAKYNTEPRWTNNTFDNYLKEVTTKGNTLVRLLWETEWSESEKKLMSTNFVYLFDKLIYEMLN